MNHTLSHEQAIQLLHEAVHHLDANQQADLTAHLTECEQCRKYADQLNLLQPVLRHALRTRRYARAAEPGETAQAILQRQRRSAMRKQIIAILGTAAVAVIAIAVIFSSRIPAQSMTGAQLAPSATPTTIPSPTSTPPPSSLATRNPFQSPLSPAGADRFEPNDNFEQATPIEANVKYDQLNFVMSTPTADGWDNDYFKVQVKPDILITCRTFDLSGGADTNLILYDESLNGITGNDDANPGTGDKSSRVGYVATYDGWLYILVSEGFSRPPAEAQQAIYSLECSTSK